ncbi:tyrosine-type recombinase/integrase [Thermotalea metallivorans]|uniref:Transposase from transposon Tn916 n=1 Tax=Thermotalea metallivorans TaxID=520762 RepID=A0A140LCH0_9FIRM|nr:tyrosine-type recombinase/integrase [Thermotalea metallivorans]KXG78245.1 Transposase from transposon Tn916 [Thermotalea metallivorans]
MRGSIVKRGNKYAIVVYLGVDEHGKKRQKWFSGYNSKKEAEKDLPRKLLEVEQGYYFGTGEMFLKDVAEEWKRYAKKNLAAQTYARYDDIIRLSIIPKLGNMKISKIKTLHLQKYINDLEMDGKSYGTINNHYFCLKSILEQAVRWQLIPQNPILGIVKPKKNYRSFKVWDIDIVKKFLSIIEDKPYYIAYLIALTTGMRQGEICALRWEDYDEAQGTLTIRHSMQRNMELKEPKTGKTRKIALMEETKRALKKQRIRQKELKLMLQDEYEESGYICTNPSGQPYNPKTLLSTFKRIVEHSGLPQIRFHDLRHTFATIALKTGIHVKIVSEILGHSKIQMTLDLYSHVLPNMQKEATNLLEKTMFL